ncbi:MAG TPA: hypothetical protein VHP64_00280, partial [Candidatus Limnocylindria bacterium]|nr:hypothetical protein [Candidatus Limnocylindria bacterium]
GPEGTQLEYKYALDHPTDWHHVEKGLAPECAELANRQLTLAYGTGTQAVNDTVDNWRNVEPCGN